MNGQEHCYQRSYQQTKKLQQERSTFWNSKYPQEGALQQHDSYNRADDNGGLQQLPQANIDPNQQGMGQRPDEVFESYTHRPPHQSHIQYQPSHPHQHQKSQHSQQAPKQHQYHQAPHSQPQPFQQHPQRQYPQQQHSQQQHPQQQQQHPQQQHPQQQHPQQQHPQQSQTSKCSTSHFDTTPSPASKHLQPHAYPFLPPPPPSHATSTQLPSLHNSTQRHHQPPQLLQQRPQQSPPSPQVLPNNHLNNPPSDHSLDQVPTPFLSNPSCQPLPPPSHFPSPHQSNDFHPSSTLSSNTPFSTVSNPSLHISHMAPPSPSHLTCTGGYVPFDEANLPGRPLPSVMLPTRVNLLKNDYNQHFVDTGERPQNFIRDADPSERFTEYPKLERLIRLKDHVNTLRAHPAQYIKADLSTFDLKSLGSLFDVILVDPPWTEYQQRVVGGYSVFEDLTPWTCEQISSLKVGTLADTPSFCFMWAGEQHLEDARKCLQSWGFRRCEDICWIKINRREIARQGGRSFVMNDENAILQRTKEHCLMGIRGAVRRSTDTHFIHANVDTDVILAEPPEESGSTSKPAELYDIIERFCLGRRKIELFGTDKNIRRGWVTLGNSISISKWDRDKYLKWLSEPPIPPQVVNPRLDYFSFPEIGDHHGGRYLGSTGEIELLRPKSPPRSSQSSTVQSNASSRSTDASGGNPLLSLSS